MNYYLLSIIIFGVFIAILYLRSSEHQRLLYSQKYIRDRLSGTLGFDKFKEKAEQMLINQKNKFALIYLVTDSYHDIANEYGRETADNILRIIGIELNRRVLPDFPTTRQAGDQFFCLVPFDSEESHMHWFEGLASMVESEVRRICNLNIQLRGSLYICSSEESLEGAFVKTTTLLGKKDFYKEKSNFFIINSTECNENTNLPTEEIEAGFKNDEFKVYFQPQYNIFTNEIVGAEALLRWENPQRGIILPGFFIPFLTDQNQLIGLEKLVLETVCKFLGLRLALGLQVFPISCNFSLEHFKDENFVDNILKIADKYNVPYKLLIVELAEHLASEDVELVAIQSEKIKGKGFRVAIDNFGAGHFSLRILSEIKLDILKIDRRRLTVCDNDRDIKIVKGMATIAKELNIVLMCEGIETKEQIAIMKSLPANIAQGFYYCQPLDQKQFENLLKVSKIELVNSERRSINIYGQNKKIPSYSDLGDLFPQIYDFVLEINLKDGTYYSMALNPTGNVFIPYTGRYSKDYTHIIKELLYPEDIQKFIAHMSLDALIENYNATSQKTGFECRFVGFDGVAQRYKLRIYYWYGRSRALITAKNIMDFKKNSTQS